MQSTAYYYFTIILIYPFNLSDISLIYMSTTRALKGNLKSWV